MVVVRHLNRFKLLGSWLGASPSSHPGTWGRSSCDAGLNCAKLPGNTDSSLRLKGHNSTYMIYTMNGLV